MRKRKEKKEREKERGGIERKRSMRSSAIFVALKRIAVESQNRVSRLLHQCRRIESNQRDTPANGHVYVTYALARVRAISTPPPPPPAVCVYVRANGHPVCFKRYWRFHDSSRRAFATFDIFLPRALSFSGPSQLDLFLSLSFRTAKR